MLGSLKSVISRSTRLFPGEVVSFENQWCFLLLPPPSSSQRKAVLSGGGDYSLQHKGFKRTGCWHPEGKNKTRGTFPPHHWKGIWDSESLLSLPIVCSCRGAGAQPWAPFLGKAVIAFPAGLPGSIPCSSQAPCERGDFMEPFMAPLFTRPGHRVTPRRTPSHSGHRHSHRNTGRIPGALAGPVSFPFRPFCGCSNTRLQFLDRARPALQSLGRGHGFGEKTQRLTWGRALMFEWMMRQRDRRKERCGRAEGEDGSHQGFPLLLGLAGRTHTEVSPIFTP